MPCLTSKILKSHAKATVGEVRQGSRQPHDLGVASVKKFGAVSCGVAACRVGTETYAIHGNSAFRGHDWNCNQQDIQRDVSECMWISVRKVARASSLEHNLGVNLGINNTWKKGGLWTSNPQKKKKQNWMQNTMLWHSAVNWHHEGTKKRHNFATHTTLFY